MSRPCSPKAACERAFYQETMVMKVVDSTMLAQRCYRGVS